MRLLTSTESSGYSCGRVDIDILEIPGMSEYIYRCNEVFRGIVWNVTVRGAGIGDWMCGVCVHAVI